ncbi:MAG: hypothetical protein M0R17_02675 [Candidatus Omnitrophica bacterium]|jgi:hypothetical protein|nr:hypothetical protein [Candidatus Omnitrophota bacterium]
MNTLAIAIYQRPELVYLYLEQLLKEPKELENIRVHFFLDYCFNTDIYKVIHWFRKYHKHIKITTRTLEDKNKCPLPGFYNILDSYRIAAEESEEYILPAEEDMTPTQDYLRFNRICYEKFLSRYNKLFCVSHKRRPEIETSGDISQLIGDSQCCSPSCISVKVVKNYILPYLTDELYNNPVAFYNKHFNNIRIPYNEHIHGDGFTERCMLKHGLYALKPDQTRSMHVGVGGLHSGSNELIGSLEDKVKWYYDKISLGSEELRKYASSAKEDIVVCNLDNPSWNDLEIDFNRNKCKASSICYDLKNTFKREILCL